MKGAVLTTTKNQWSRIFAHGSLINNRKDAGAGVHYSI